MGIGQDYGSFDFVESTNASNVTVSTSWTQLDSETFDDAVRTIAQEVANVVIEKQKDYGPKNILDAPFSPQHGLVVRLWDKMARLKNLLETGAEPKNESIEDTYIDLIGYSLIALMVRRGKFELPLKLEK